MTEDSTGRPAAPAAGSGRWRKLVEEAAKFGIIGVVNTVVDFVVFNLLLSIGPLKANVVSTVVATTVSYGLNRHWTYRDRPRSALRREYVLFFAFNLIGMGIQLAVLGIAKYGLNFTEHDHQMALNAAKAIGIAIGTVFRFFAYRTWVFRSAKTEPAGTGAEAARPAETAEPALTAED